MKRRIAALVFLAVVGGLPHANAQVTLNDAGWTHQIYDTGGNLDPANNGGYYLDGLEVAPDGSAVYVLASDNYAGPNTNVFTTSVRLIRSTGMGTAALDASGPFDLSYAKRGADLTRLGDAYYVAATETGTPGIYGITPGSSTLTSFAAGGSMPGWGGTGLTFNAAGDTALVTNDGDVSENGAGHYSIALGASSATLLVDQSSPPPTGYDGIASDHVVTSDGRTIVNVDVERRLTDVTGGPGSVFEWFDIESLFTNAGSVGARTAIDPVTGDIFVGYAAGAGLYGIYRVNADGSGGSVFADGFLFGVRDLDFGLASNGSGAYSLYATEATYLQDLYNRPDVGTIHEFSRERGQGIIPEPASLVVWSLLAALGIGIGWRRRKNRA